MKLLKKIYITLLVFTLLAYLSVWISPKWFWLLGFITLSIPTLLIYYSSFSLFFLIKKKYVTSLYFIIPLLIGFPFIKASFGIAFLFNDSTKDTDFSVLSYNARVFNVYNDLNQSYISSKAMIQWVKNDDSDIKCLQEFYNKDVNTIFNTKERIGNSRHYYSYISAGSLLNAGNGFGLAIFSRFPFIKKGHIKFNTKTENQVIFADVVIRQDTVRVYNTHLESMSINQQTFKGLQQFKYYFKELSDKLERGMQQQAIQVDKIVAHIETSPYPVVLCGDLNATPYSYPYFKLKSKLYNSFEQAGNGFGFTFNHPKLFFLRIDNQFFSPRLSAHKHQTHQKVDFSDHFPISVRYKFINKPH